MPRDLTRDRSDDHRARAIMDIARREAIRELRREEYQRKLAAETERLCKIGGRSIWRRMYDAIIPFTITIRRTK
jgi:hypothetical protein